MKRGKEGLPEIISSKESIEEKAFLEFQNFRASLKSVIDKKYPEFPLLQVDDLTQTEADMRGLVQEVLVRARGKKGKIQRNLLSQRLKNIQDNDSKLIVGTAGSLAIRLEELGVDRIYLPRYIGREISVVFLEKIGTQNP